MSTSRKDSEFARCPVLRDLGVHSRQEDDLIVLDIPAMLGQYYEPRKLLQISDKPE